MDRIRDRKLGQKRKSKDKAEEESMAERHQRDQKGRGKQSRREDLEGLEGKGELRAENGSKGTDEGTTYGQRA